MLANTKAPMDIVFVGAGRLATNLAMALHAKGHRITAVYSRTMASARMLAEAVDARATDDLAALPLEADAFVIAMKDAVLADVVAQLHQQRASQIFLHTAGSMPLSVFGSHCHGGVVYPMQTFSKERLVDFAPIHVFIEGCDAQTLQVARQVASAVSSHVIELSSEERRHLHLAAVFACNFANHCYALSAEILERHGLPFSAMLPLIDETARKVSVMTPREAQTGPAVRYDRNVMAAQEQLLAGEPEMQQIYEMMSKSIHRLADD